MAESATPNAPNENTPSPVVDQSYVDLANHILSSLDSATAIAEKHNGGSHLLQGRIEAYEGLLHWLSGYEDTDFDGLRARFGEQR